MKLRRTALVVLSASCVAVVAAPASAGTVGVSLTGVGGTRNFNAYEADGTTLLTTLPLGTSTSKGFVTKVEDAGFAPENTNYTVKATLSNLYLKKPDGSFSSTTKIPSSQLKLTPAGLGFDPLQVKVTPVLDVAGSLGDCTTPDVAAALGLDLTVLTGPLGLTGALTALGDPAVTTLCTTLKLGSTVRTATGTIAKAATTVTSTVNQLADLPNALSADGSTAFTNADYSQFPAAASDPAKPATNNPTSVVVMRGAQATLPTTLLDDLKAKVAATLGSTLTTANDAGAKVTRSELLGTLSDATLRTQVAALPDGLESALLNTLSGAVSLAAPVLGDLGLTTTYRATPSLVATSRNAPVGGQYEGVMTLTFVQG